MGMNINLELLWSFSNPSRGIPSYNYQHYCHHQRCLYKPKNNSSNSNNSNKTDYNNNNTFVMKTITTSELSIPALICSVILPTN